MSKKHLFGFALLSLLILLGACASGRVPASDSRALDSIYAEARQGKIAVDFDYVTPMQLPPHILTTPYSLMVSNDSLDSQLPYFGEAYRSDYGSTRSPLDFKTQMKAYDVARQRDRVMMKMTVYRQPEQFDYLLTIFANGKASLHVNSNYRQSINFDGDLR